MMMKLITTATKKNHRLQIALQYELSIYRFTPAKLGESYDGLALFIKTSFIE
jgi:hypothetical protein